MAADAVLIEDGVVIGRALGEESRRGKEEEKSRDYLARLWHWLVTIISILGRLLGGGGKSAADKIGSGTWVGGTGRVFFQVEGGFFGSVLASSKGVAAGGFADDVGARINELLRGRGLVPVRGVSLSFAVF